MLKLKEMKQFEEWWYNIGSGIIPKENDDYETHAYNVCKAYAEYINNQNLTTWTKDKN